jgi:Poxvirus A22 protein
MRLLSIDVGTRNLGVCVLLSGNDPKGTTDRIRHWRVLQLPTPVTALGLQEALREPLEEWGTYDAVVIERQPGKSHTMQRIQHYCEMLFSTRGNRVSVMEARNKLVFAANTPWWPPNISANKWTYRERKTAAVATIRVFLQATDQDPEHRALFDRSSKRDDLADSALQAMGYAHVFAALESAAAEPVPLKPRRPTPKQLQSGKLSNHHIAYLLQEANVSTAEEVAALPSLRKTLRARFANDPTQLLAACGVPKKSEEPVPGESTDDQGTATT